MLALRQLTGTPPEIGTGVPYHLDEAHCGEGSDPR